MKGSVTTRPSPWSWCLILAIALFLATFMVYPILYVFVRSFYIGGQINFGFFPLMFQNPIIRASIVNSLLIGISTTLLTTAIALPLAYIFNNFKFPGSAFLQALVLVPLVLPPFVGAIGIKKILASFGSLNLLLLKTGLIHDPVDWFMGGSIFAVVILESLNLYPIMFLNLTAAMANVDPSLEEAALSAGASRSRLLRKITLPLMIPGFFAGAVIVFIWSFTDLGTPLIFDFQQTISVQIFNMVKNVNENPLGYALVVLVIALTLLLFWASKEVMGKRRYEMLARGHVTGREKPARRWEMMLFYLVIIGLVVVALLPHASVFLFSIADRWGSTILPPEITAAHYVSVFTDPKTSIAIRNSFFYSIFSTLLDVLLGVTIAYQLTRKRFPGSRLLDILAMLPLALPGIILAFGYVATFSGTLLDPRQNPTLLLIFSYGLRRMPYMVRSAYAGFQQTSISLEEAAQSLGASSRRTLKKITIPLITANLLAGTLLCFAYAMLEVSDSLILAMREEYFPITKAIFDLTTATSGGAYVACALGITGMIILATAILVAGRILGKRMGELFRAG